LERFDAARRKRRRDIADRRNQTFAPAWLTWFSLLSGAVLTEQVFTIPGFAKLC